MPDGVKYWAFLSYSSQDVTWARWLQRAIETYRVPRRFVGRPTAAGPTPRWFRPIFRDRTELAVETDLSVSIKEALGRSAFLIVVCSPDAAKSRWVNEEIRQFRALYGGDRILPVIVAGRADAPRDEAFPPALLERGTPGDTPLGRTPVAADLRPGGDGRRVTRLRLVAGMLGVGLDDLIRRDTQRRHRQMVAVSAASLVGMAIAAALATAAWVSRNKAVKERAQADRLVAFMLDDLHNRLAQSRRLDLMDRVARQALNYYSAEDPADLDAGSLEKRSAAVNLMGEIELQRGDLPDAARAFAAASATTAELLARDRNDGKRVYAHAQSVFWVGEVARERGQTTQAEARFRDYLRLARRLTALDRRDDDWLGEVDNASSDLGTLYLQLGRAPAALQAFRESLAVSETLAKRRPADLDRRMDLGQSHAWLADALEMEGELRAARVEREQELGVYRDILRRDPHFQKAEFSAAVAEQAHAELGKLMGDAAGSAPELEDAARRAERLAAAQPDDVDTATVAAIAQVRLGEAMLALGRRANAEAASRRARAPLASAVAKAPAVVSWRAYGCEAALLEGALAEAAGDGPGALRLDDEVLRDLTRGDRPAFNTYALWLLELARLQTGDDLMALRRPVEARAQWVAVVGDLATTGNLSEPKTLTVLAAVDGRLGRKTEAASVLRRLARMRA